MATAKQRLNLTLDTMQETFRADPSDTNAKRYRDVALEYWEDEMIGDDTLLGVLKQIRDGDLVPRRNRRERLVDRTAENGNDR